MIELKKSLNNEVLKQILESFTTLTEIRSAFIDHSAEYKIGSNLSACDFCNKLHQQPDMLEECIKSDNSAFKIAQVSKAPILYKCHAGLWEAVIPLFVRNTHVGFLMLGQVKCSEKPELDWYSLNKILKSKELNINTIENIKQAYDSTFEISKEKIEAAVKIMDIISNYIINSKAVDLIDSGPVEKARTYIEKNSAKSIATRSIADEAGVSYSYLSYIFHKEVGQTVTEYIENCRLKQACELLSQTSLSCKEISTLCGYENQNYFSHVFKKRMGISPTRYKDIQTNKRNTE